MPGWRHPDLRFLCSDAPLDPLLMPQYGCSLELKSEKAGAMVEEDLFRVFTHRISSRYPPGHVRGHSDLCWSTVSCRALVLTLRCRCRYTVIQVTSLQLLTLRAGEFWLPLPLFLNILTSLRSEDLLPVLVTFLIAVIKRPRRSSSGKEAFLLEYSLKDTVHSHGEGVVAGEEES